MKQSTTRQLILSALFSAIIFLSITYLKFEIAPRTMVHLGNALVVIAYLSLGLKFSLISASLGLMIYDLLNGYIDSIFFTVMESVVVILIIHAIFSSMQQKYTLKNIIVIAFTASLTKIVLIFIRRFITFTLISGIQTALPLTIARMTNTFITAIFTVIAVPILFNVLKPLILKMKSNFIH